MAERIPPHSEEAEVSVLGAFIQSEYALNETAETLVREDFFNPALAEIFDAISELHRESKSVDLTTLTDALNRRGTLDAVGGAIRLAELSAAVPSPSNARYYADILREKRKLRELIKAAGDIITMSYSESENVDEVIEKAEQSVLDIAKEGQGTDYKAIKNILNANMDEMKERAKHPGALTGLKTDFKMLDDYTLGLQKSDLIILAARPSIGKTSLALNIASNVAMSGKSVLIFSLEMNAHLLGGRLLASKAGVDSKEIQTGEVMHEPDKLDRITEAMESLGSAKIHIDDNSGISIAEMKNKCRRLRGKEGLDLVVVDYLQLMDFGGNGRASARPENRQQEIATLSRMLKQLARDMECPVLVLSQLSRAVENRAGKKPILADLRESGAIEQDADVVLFIHKEERGEREDDDNGPDPETTRKIIIAKHRNGETGEFVLRWVGKFTRFGDYNFGDDLNDAI